MLRLGSYPWSLKRRIMSRFGHLSNDDSMTAVRKMIGAELKTLCMIHLSQKNNHEAIVREMTSSVVDRLGARLEIGIARQFEPTGIFEITRKSARKTPPAQMALF
jgi:phosphoribosyl 1,2-cyclic phosphodiesterase